MTLQAKDLMIGDWVKLKYTQKPVKVKEIKQSCVYTEGNGYKYDEIESILLTPEILEKNGFAKVVEIEHDCTYRLLIPTSYKDTPYSIQFTFCNDPTSGVNTIFNCWGPISSEGRGVNDIHMCNIESVHELQHVLKLCKIGKEIEL